MDAPIDAAVADFLKGAVDLHCHSGPSLMPRRLDHVEAIRQATLAGFSAVVFKDHWYPTGPIAEMINTREAEGAARAIGAVVLNHSVGGLNPSAVADALRLGARFVWMPTVSAANHIRSGRSRMSRATPTELDGPELSVLDARGLVRDELKAILDLIAEYDAVLAGGHLHISEIWPLYEEAVARGVNRRVVNHPTFLIGATLADLEDIASTGTFIEHSICMFIKSEFQVFTEDQLKEVIEAGGINQTYFGSDLGQANNPTPVEGFAEIIRICLSLGYDSESKSEN